MATISDSPDDCRPRDPEYRFFSDADAWSYMDHSTAEVMQVPEPSCVHGEDRELPEIFFGLAKIWKDATGGLSSTARRFAHPTYKAILRLGPEAIPFILQELQQRPDWWFDALEFLAKENPAKSTDSFEDALAAWVKWGKSRPPG